MGRLTPEKKEQKAILSMLDAAGAKTYQISQGRFVPASMKGIGDLLAFIPTRFLTQPLELLWVEVKGGKNDKGRVDINVYPEQRIFQMMCKLARVEHVIGTSAEVEQFLRRIRVWNQKASGVLDAGELLEQSFGHLYVDSMAQIALTRAAAEAKRKEKRALAKEAKRA